MSSRKRAVLVIAVVLLIVLAAGAALLVLRSRAGARDRERFEEEARRNWKKISRRSAEVASRLQVVEAPQDLEAVSIAAEEMRGLLKEMTSSLESGSVPGDYEDLAAMQIDAVESLDLYLQSVTEFAKADARTLAEGRGILEDRSRRAFSSVNEFLTEAPFALERPVAEFYQAGPALSRAWSGPSDVESAEAAVVYDTVTRFLDADKEEDFQELLGMVSSRLLTAFDYYNVSSDDLARDWRRSWDGKKLVDYYVSRSEISFPEPDLALVKVVAYVDDGTPIVDTVRLVREQGSWKVDGYPYVGWE